MKSILFLVLLLTLQISTANATTTSVKIIPGEKYLNEVQGLISNAKTSIDLLEFNFFSESGSTRELANQLIKLKSQNPNLRIRIALESEKDLAIPTGAAFRNNITKNLFANSGIEIYPITGIRENSIKGVSHAKAICIDQVILLAGSTNWTNTSINLNNEMNAEINSFTIGHAFTNYYNQLILKSSIMYPSKAIDENVSLITDTDYFDELIYRIKQIKQNETIDIQMYFFAYRTEKDLQVKQIINELIQAHNRGAIIHIMLEQNANSNISPEVTEANFNVAKILKDNGISEIYLDPANKISHTKMVIFNSKTILLGSTNFYRGDFNENHQVNFIINDLNEATWLQNYFVNKIKNEGIRF